MDTDVAYRPDLIFYNMPETNKVVFGAIRITCLTIVSTNTNVSLLMPENLVVQRQFQEEKRKINNAKNGLEFKKIILKSTESSK